MLDGVIQTIVERKQSLPTKTETISISKPSIGASCGERVNRMPIVPKI